MMRSSIGPGASPRAHSRLARRSGAAAHQHADRRSPAAVGRQQHRIELFHCRPSGPFEREAAVGLHVTREAANAEVQGARSLRDAWTDAEQPSSRTRRSGRHGEFARWRSRPRRSAPRAARPTGWPPASHRIADRVPKVKDEISVAPPPPAHERSAAHLFDACSTIVVQGPRLPRASAGRHRAAWACAGQASSISDEEQPTRHRVLATARAVPVRAPQAYSVVLSMKRAPVPPGLPRLQREQLVLGEHPEHADHSTVGLRRHRDPQPPDFDDGELHAADATGTYGRRALSPTKAC